MLGFVIGSHIYSLVSTNVPCVFPLDCFTCYQIRGNVYIAQHTHTVSSNMPRSDTDFYASWLSIFIFCDIILTFLVDAIHLLGAQIVFLLLHLPYFRRQYV
jgi:hypothetical protein